VAAGDGPVPDDPKRIQFLLDGLGPNFAPLPFLLRTLVAVALHVRHADRLDWNTLAEDSTQMLAVEALCRQRVRFLAPFRDCSLVHFDELVKPEDLRKNWFPGRLSVRQDEHNRIGAGWYLQAAILHQPKGFLNPRPDTIGDFAIRRLSDRLNFCPPNEKRMR
jgi:hypothetical protein